MRARQSYGSPRLYAQLSDDGIAVDRLRVARLTRENGLKARQRTRFKRTTDSRNDQPIVRNLLDQDFTCDGPDHRNGMPISAHIRTKEGFLYLAIVVDFYSRWIVGWDIGERINKRRANPCFDEGDCAAQSGFRSYPP